MLKFSRRNKRLVIPVGINPNYGIDKADLYNTNDADVVANDVLKDKIAYGKDGKIVGTLDLENEKEESYQEGYEFGYDEGNEAGYRLGYDEGVEAGIDEQKAKLEGITITENGSYNREDGWNSVVVDVPDLNGDYNEGYIAGETEQKSKLTSITITENGSYNRENGYNEVIVDVPDLNGDYNEGVEAGIEIGKAEVIEGMNDATITARTVLKGEIGYGKNNERIVGEFEYVEGFDFGKIGYSQELSDETNNDTIESIAYSKQLMDGWNPATTNASRYFQKDVLLMYAPLVDTSNVTDMSYFLYQCPNLQIIPNYNYDKVTNMQNFCSYSGNMSLNLDLKSCTSANMITSYNTNIIDASINFNNTDCNCYGMFYGCTNLKNVHIKNVNSTSSNSTFQGCSNLTTITFENFATSTCNGMFQSCSKLTSVPLFDTSNATDMSYMFSGCSNLTSVPEFDTSNATNIGYMFSYCSNLTSVPEFNCSRINSLSYTNSPIRLFNGANNVSELGGFMHLGEGYTAILGSSNAALQLQDLSQLTHESCMNVINKVYDMNLNTVFTNTASIRFHATPYSLLSADDIAIATAKGWTVQAG